MSSIFKKSIPERTDYGNYKTTDHTYRCLDHRRWNSWMLCGAYDQGKKVMQRSSSQRKPNIKRSGCLAAGVNAINAYIVKGRKPQDYVDYARKDADEIVRGDLLLTMSERLK